MADLDEGFTLIEVLIVLVLIGIMIGVVAPRLGGDIGVSARREGARLVTLLKAARSQAIVTGKPYQVVFGADGYRFLTLDGKGRFVAARGRLLRARVLPKGVTLVEPARRHALLFAPSGLSRAFHVALVTHVQRFVITGNADGRIRGALAP